MSRPTTPVLLLGMAWIVACSKDVAAPRGTRTYPVPFRSDYTSKSYEFLRTYVGRRSLVQVGESIHVTDEFPRVRLHMVRYLHEELGFDVIAFEGSLVGSWLAQDFLYRSNDPLPAKATHAQELAWFGLWQTEPMRLVMEYVAQTQTTGSPLYLASFDVQPGTSRIFGGSAEAALQALFDAVRRYSALQDDRAEGRWRDALSPFLDCYRSTSPKTSEERSRALAAIGELERWIAEACPMVALATSPVHASALRRIPESLRGSVELCDESTRSGSAHAYQEVRDRISATHAMALRDAVSREHRVILWAHHSHIQHNSTGKNVPSMGQHLLQLAGADLYTIGLFAGRGRAVEVSDDAFPPVVPRRIPPASRYGLESRLALTHADDYFIDFSMMDPGRPDQAVWFSEVSSRMETRDMAYGVPARDYHAAVFVQVVHPASLTMLPPAIAIALTAYGFMVDHLISVIAGVTILFGLIIRRRRRRRRVLGLRPAAQG